MKNTIKLMIGLLAVGFVSCEPEFESPVAENFYTNGDADFSNFVAVGNSLTSGYADGALYLSGQENSYPNIMAQQFAFAGGGAFTQPLMNDNLGGLLLGGAALPGFGNRLVLSVDAAGNPGPALLEGNGTTEVSNVISGPFNNMGVPGAKSFHFGAEGYGNVGALPSANPYYIRMATSPNATIIGDAVAQSPSFFSLWIGNNDILSYATNGGSGMDQTGNLDLSTYGSTDITDPNVFASVYAGYVDALTANGAGGVLMNIADVTSIPFFTTVPTQSVPLDAASAGALNAQFTLYNTQVLPGLVGVGLLTPEEAASREINFSAGANFPVMMDDDLTDIAPILQGPPFSLPAATAAILGQLRQVNDTDLVVLRASAVLGTTPDPTNPQGVIGISIPLGDQFVLTAVEQGRVATAAAAYNATIQALASAKGLGFADVKSALAEVANGGIGFDGGLLTSTYVTGGAFSLDGVHPSPRGYANTANVIINEINRTYNATIPTVNIGDYGTVTLHNNQ